MRFRSNLGGAIRFHEKVGRNMLLAAARVVQNQAKRNVRGGFKSGDFVSGNIINKIDVEVDPRAMVARIGTEVRYGAYWELGHHNTFTRKYERKEWLKPALTKTKLQQKEAAKKAARRTAGPGGFGLGVSAVTRPVK